MTTPIAPIALIAAGLRAVCAAEPTAPHASKTANLEGLTVTLTRAKAEGTQRAEAAEAKLAQQSEVQP